jgi:hypothetical protein
MGWFFWGYPYGTIVHLLILTGQRKAETTSLSWARCVCARFCNRTRAITNDIRSTGHWTKMHRSLVKFSESEASNHTPSAADFTTTTPELKCSVHTGW